jgi:signal transduction histidine kinase/DNA-binding NarL/FixJ family response regulator
MVTETKTILIVEHNELNLKLMTAVLRLGPYLLLTAGDTESGLQLAREHLPDLILMDLQLPGLDGISATTIIKADEQLRHIPVIGLSDHGSLDFGGHPGESGFSGVITKLSEGQFFLETLSGYLGIGPRVSKASTNRVMQTARTNNEPIQELAARTPSSDNLGVMYKRYLQGAWVRSVASAVMWFFALLTYYLKSISFFCFVGSSFSVLYLILINPPTLWMMKRTRQKKRIAALSLAIHGLEIIGYTAIIYFAGSMSRGYLTLLFAALITYVGVMSPRHWPFIVTAFSSLSLFGMIALEYLQVIPDTNFRLTADYPYSLQLLELLGMTSVFLIISFISSYTSGIVRRGRAQLKAQNAALLETKDKLEQAQQGLIEKNRALETAMERAQASDRKKSEFLANMSHELRTPLNHIIGFTELVVDKNFGELNTEQEEFLTDVLHSGRHLLAVINEILDLSKVESGKMDLKYSTVYLHPLVENSLVMMKEKALKHRIELSTEISDQPETLEADERKLKQILYNLLANAVKFTPDGGSVLVRLSPENGLSDGHPGLRFSVIDTGIGLEVNDLERVFQPFEQADNSASRKYQGTGLGLALTKKMVELHGGKIWAESEGIGRGSAFHVIIPISPGGEVLAGDV